MAEDNRQPAPPATPEKRSVGETLKAARNAQSLTLEQVATELRIELPQLEALEGDRFERIGVPVFVKGYLRQYGARLGLDPRDLLMQYYQQNSLKEVQVQPSKTIKLRDERQITVWVIAALAILVVIVGLAAWWVGGGGSPVASPSTRRPAATEAAPRVDPARRPRGARDRASERRPRRRSAVCRRARHDAGPSARAASPAPTSSPWPRRRRAAAAPRIARSRRARRRAARLRAADRGRAAAAAATAAGDRRRGRRTSVARVPLEITFEQESWAEVTDARGERIYYGLGTAGKHAQMRGEPPFAVVLGNARA